MSVPMSTDTYRRDRDVIEALARAIFDAEEEFYRYEPGCEPRGERHFKVAITHYYALAHAALEHLRSRDMLKD